MPSASTESLIPSIIFAFAEPFPWRPSNGSLLATLDEDTPNPVTSPEEEQEFSRLRKRAYEAAELRLAKRARYSPIHPFNEWLRRSLEDRPAPESTCRMCTFTATRFVTLSTHLMVYHISPAMKAMLRSRAPFDTSDRNKDLLLHFHFTATRYRSLRPNVIDEINRFLRNYTTTPNADGVMSTANTQASDVVLAETSPSLDVLQPSVDLKTTYPNLFYRAIFIAQECVAPHVRQNLVCSCGRRFATSHTRALHMHRRNVAGPRNHSAVPRPVMPPPS